MLIGVYYSSSVNFFSTSWKTNFKVSFPEYWHVLHNHIRVQSYRTYCLWK